jgi:hypothetical protein
MLRSIKKGTVEKRAAQWLEQLRSQKTESLPAGLLYAGDHWSIVRSLDNVSLAGGSRVRVWVCSAGYGLIGLRTQVRPYSATFAPNHSDSVCRKVEEMKIGEIPALWWRSLSKWSGPDTQAPRSLTQVAKTFPRSPLWVVASEIYLKAIADKLTAYFIPCDARFQRMVGGARRSLNIRVAKKALTELNGSEPRLSSLQKKFAILLAKQPPIVLIHRRPLLDEEVREFIRKALKRDPHKTHTFLLRALRNSGRACEQRRFAVLFREIWEELNRG